MKRVFLLLLFYFPAFTIADAQQMVTEVIPLGYRTINEIIPVVRPLISPAGSVTGLQGQLVVTATPQAMAEVRKVLGSLDKSPARLLISVRRGDSHTAKQGSASVQGRTGNIAINNGGVIVGTADGHHDADKDSLSVQAKSNRRTEDMNITQQVQVLEGREAYISTGEEVPVRNRGAVAGPGGVYRYDNTEFYPAVTGFYAIPRLNGDEVFLEINSVSRMRNNIRLNGRYPRQDRRNATVSNVSTSVGGKLGDWIAIGNVDQSRANRLSGIAALSRQQEETSSQIYVRVEKIQNGY